MGKYNSSGLGDTLFFPITFFSVAQRRYKSAACTQWINTDRKNWKKITKPVHSPILRVLLKLSNSKRSWLANGAPVAALFLVTASFVFMGKKNNLPSKTAYFSSAIGVAILSHREEKTHSKSKLIRAVLLQACRDAIWRSQCFRSKLAEFLLLQ